MNGKRARIIRKFVYGDTYSHRFRNYKRLPTGQIVADERRVGYQKEKKDYVKTRKN